MKPTSYPEFGKIRTPKRATDINQHAHRSTCGQFSKIG